MTRMFALGRQALAAALLLAACPAQAHMVAADWGGADLPLPMQGRVLVRYESATLSIAGARWQAEGHGTDGPAVIGASHAEGGEEAGDGEGGDSFSGSGAEYGGFQGFVPSSPASLSLEERVSRIEGYLPHLATKADLLAVEVRLEKAIAALRVEMQAEITDLRSEMDKKLQEQFRDYLWFNGSMLAGLFAAFALFVRLILPSGSLVLATVRTAPEEDGAEPSSRQPKEDGKGG